LDEHLQRGASVAAWRWLMTVHAEQKVKASKAEREAAALARLKQSYR